jgi:hypothetical protein
MSTNKILKQQDYRGYRIVVSEGRFDFAVSFGKEGSDVEPPLLGWFDDADTAMTAGKDLIDLIEEQAQRLGSRSQATGGNRAQGEPATGAGMHLH